MPQKPQNATITHKQETFLLAYLSLPTLQSACVTAGISDETARRWLKQEQVQTRYAELRRQYLDTSLQALTRHADTAIETLARHMTDSETLPAQQIRAAQLLLEKTIELYKMSDLERQIEELRGLLEG